MVYDATVEVWLAFILTTIGLCWLWVVSVGRGPFEWVLHRVSTKAADVAPDELPTPPPVSDTAGQAHS